MGTRVQRIKTLDDRLTAVDKGMQQQEQEERDEKQITSAVGDIPGYVKASKSTSNTTPPPTAPAGVQSGHRGVALLAGGGGNGIRWPQNGVRPASQAFGPRRPRSNSRWPRPSGRTSATRLRVTAFVGWCLISRPSRGGTRTMAGIESRPA